MRTRTRNPFLTVRTEGAILPTAILSRVLDRDKDLDGLTAESYHLTKNERINEVATRGWNRLQGAWEAFREAADRLPETDLGTTLTRERWLQVLFQELGYGRLMTQRAWELDGRTYPISHLWASTPIHLVGCRVKMDIKQAGVAGAARVSPHSLVQEFLNRSDDHLWGIVSNGLTLRLLRDNVSLTRQAFVEFDLEAMMEGEAFSDFVLLFMLCHQSRVELPEDKTPESCWLEQWHNAAAEQGIRALDTLRAGVQQAINALGAGFLAHPANTGLRSKLKEGLLSTQDYYRQILRVVYRLLFLFVAEDRELLYDPSARLENRKTYADYYSTKRIRDLAQRRRGTKHADLYRCLQLVFEKLREGCPELALPALGSFLFSDEATPDLDSVDLANRELLEAIRKLACTVEDNTLRPIDYRNLGPEELGSVYESLLEMHPQVNTDAATFKLDVAAGSERKTTGSFYTHSSLVQCLLDSALDPVLDEAVKKPDPEAALLDLKICDPASGSGHFLIAASHRIAKRLAAVRTGEDEPSPDATRAALRDVIGRCIYGVDINPMAVELCKISLWMEAMEPGKALGFLDHHIKCGNSLLGTTPALMANGIPDNAFKPIEGDDKVVCKDLKAQNKRERGGQIALGEILYRRTAPDLATPFKKLAAEDDSSVTSREEKAEHYRVLVQSAEYENSWLLADAWCAAFVLPKTSLDDLAVTHRRFRNWEANADAVELEDRETVQTIADQYQFFHWHLAFPEIFKMPNDDEPLENEQCGWSGGFHCVLGNPPWERIKLQEKEFFSQLSPGITEAQNASERRRLVAQLETENPSMWQIYKKAKRRAEGESQCIRASGRYPFSERGDTNTYSVFAELAVRMISPLGSTGMILPLGIATDKTNKEFFRNLINRNSLYELLGFINERTLFRDVLHNFKFCILATVGSSLRISHPAFVFNAFSVDEASDPRRRFSLSAEDIHLVNPLTETCPVFLSRDSAIVTKMLYERLPILAPENEQNGWNLRLSSMFHMGNASNLFETEDRFKNSLPVYESKMIGQFNHRYGSYHLLAEGKRAHMLPVTSEDDLGNPGFESKPCYFVSSDEVKQRLDTIIPRGWMIGMRRIASAGLARTSTCCVLPTAGAGDSITLVDLPTATPDEIAVFVSIANSYAFDFAIRQKTAGSNLSFYVIHQLPIVPRADFSSMCSWATSTTKCWVARRVLELSYTAFGITSFAHDLAYGGPPFIWEEDRRFLIRCELDAAFFHLYLGTPQEWIDQGSKELLEYFSTPRHAVEYIMETFPIVKRKEEEQYGEYRTKFQILDIYDRMQHAINTGEPYQTLLDPPPGPPADEHGNFLPLPEWKPGHPKPPNWPSHIHPPKELK